MSRGTVRMSVIVALSIAAVAWAADGPYDFENGHKRAKSVKPTGPDSGPDPELVGLLNLEFERVAGPAALALPDRALDVLVHVKSGDLEGLIDDTARYTNTAAEWRTYTRTWLAEEQVSLATVTLPAHVVLHSAGAPFTWDVETGSGAPDEQVSLGLGAPEPEAGMPGRAMVAFGPAVPKPADAKGDHPDRLTVEFFWLGQVMPQPNGGLFPHPSPDRPGPGAWHLSDITQPWSRNTMLRL